MTNKLLIHCCEQAIEYMPIPMIVLCLLLIIGFFLIGVCYRFNEDYRYTDSLLNMSIMIASALCFFFAGFFCYDFMEVTKYPEFYMLKKTSWLEDRIENGRD